MRVEPAQAPGGANLRTQKQPVSQPLFTLISAVCVVCHAAGGYFASVDDALRLHGQFTKANDLYKRAGSLPSAATADATLFVPGALWLGFLLPGTWAFVASVADITQRHTNICVCVSHANVYVTPSIPSLCVCATHTVDKAFESAKSSASTMSQPESRRVVSYLATTPARHVAQLHSGTKATLLSGHNLRVDVAYRCVMVCC